MANIVFDVDGTLLNLKNQPRYEVISLLFILKKLGQNIYIWSGGGVDYAKGVNEKLGLRGVVIPKGKNPHMDITFDDQKIDLGEINIRVV